MFPVASVYCGSTRCASYSLSRSIRRRTFGLTNGQRGLIRITPSVPRLSLQREPRSLGCSHMVPMLYVCTISPSRGTTLPTVELFQFMMHSLSS